MTTSILGHIERAKPEEIEILMEIWWQTTQSAHPFIDVDYWRKHYDLVKTQYLPAAETWVYRHHSENPSQPSEILGFISLLAENWIGALFVREAAQGQGIGRLLLQHCQQNSPILSLTVYQDNQSAVRFYQQQGFEVIQSERQAETQAMELTMQWRKSSV